jgi:lysozyme
MTVKFSPRRTAMTYQIRTILDTFFKTSPQQSSSLPASEKVYISSKTTYPIVAYAVQNDHVKFTLGSINGKQIFLQGKNTWYAYIDSVQIINNQGQIVDLTPGKLNQAGLDLIKSFEGLSLTAYDDGTGVLTIGYGHTGSDVYSGEHITQQQAEDLLKKDLQTFETGVQKLVTVPLNPNQFAALVSFAYNVGLSALSGSTLLSLLNQGNYPGAADEFPKWDRAGGQELPGLLRRREAERSLFLS